MSKQSRNQKNKNVNIIKHKRGHNFEIPVRARRIRTFKNLLKTNYKRKTLLSNVVRKRINVLTPSHRVIARNTKRLAKNGIRRSSFIFKKKLRRDLSQRKLNLFDLFAKPEYCMRIIKNADRVRRSNYFKARLGGGQHRPEHNQKHKRTC